MCPDALWGFALFGLLLGIGEVVKVVALWTRGQDEAIGRAGLRGRIFGHLGVFNPEMSLG